MPSASIFFDIETYLTQMLLPTERKSLKAAGPVILQLYELACAN